ncbi:MAG: hypothetical protein JNK60_13330, partial [Acidobacteria bacterium]|nr:hypothetical protein [Acidobacteriota bacterium]
MCPQQTGDWHPTSRDVVSHLYAALLTSGPRRPLRGATELQRLLGPLPKGPDAEESLPAKACAVLDDLERWHLSVTSPALNHRAGALQARLERLRILSQWFPVREDQALIVGNLEGLLPAYRDDAAWAEGMAQLALFVNQSAERPEAPLVIAEEGARAYPGSPGGERCSVIARALRLEIDDPELELSPERGGQPLGSALFVSHGRAASLRFRAFPEPADLECVARAEESERAGPTEGPGEVAIEWTAKLPEPASGERSTTSIPLPLTRKGLYRLQFGREALPLLMPAFSILVTDIALLTRRRDREVEVWTVEASSGAPVRNAEVRLILRDGSPETVSATVSSSKTDAEGRAVFELPKGGSAEARFMVLARRGDDLASAFVDSNEGPPPKAVPAPSRDSKAPLLSFLLDRPSGVPGEVVRWRAGLYCALGPRSESLFQPVSGATLTLSLRDGTDGAGGTLEPLSTQEVSSGPFGEASGEIALPKLAEGSEKGWTFEVTTKALCGEVAAPRPNTATASVRLPPRMVPAGIEIALTEPTLVSGAPTLLEGIAARGGVPLPDALVRWEITAPRTVIRWAESRDRSREDRNPWGRVAEGVLSTDSQGRFSIPVVGPVSRGARDGF